MASTNKTPNYGLNQWAASDPVLREDFNADNAKIDAAIKSAASVVKLKEVTTSAAAAQVEFDLSDIDLDRYQELKFCMELLPASAVNYALEVRAYFNAVSAAGPVDTVSSVCHGVAGSIDYIIGQISNTSQTMFPSYWTIHISVSEEHSGLDTANGRYTLFGESYCDARGPSGSYADVGWNSRHFHAYLSELSKLILVIQNQTANSNQYAAGSKLKVYGVLR